MSAPKKRRGKKGVGYLAGGEKATEQLVVVWFPTRLAKAVDLHVESLNEDRRGSPMSRSDFIRQLVEEALRR